MASENFKLWVKACEETKTYLYRLEGKKDHAVYKTLTPQTAPVYHVWINGQHIIATLSLTEAYYLWARRKKWQD